MKIECIVFFGSVFDECFYKNDINKIVMAVTNQLRNQNG